MTSGFQVDDFNKFDDGVSMRSSNDMEKFGFPVSFRSLWISSTDDAPFI
jgi:hypothetical protein